MSEDPKLAALVARLEDLTATGRVRWELAEEARADSFVHATPSGAVTVLSRDFDGRDPYVVIVRDRDERMVERVVVAKDDGVAYYEALTRLYRLARRQALRADAVIEALLRDLGD